MIFSKGAMRGSKRTSFIKKQKTRGILSNLGPKHH